MRADATSKKKIFRESMATPRDIFAWQPALENIFAEGKIFLKKNFHQKFFCGEKLFFFHVWFFARSKNGQKTTFFSPQTHKYAVFGSLGRKKGRFLGGPLPTYPKNTKMTQIEGGQDHQFIYCLDTQPRIKKGQKTSFFFPWLSKQFL